MRQSILTLRVNRRAIGAAVLTDEALTIAEGRHLSSRSERTLRASNRYVSWLIDLTKPAALVLDAPSAGRDEHTTARVVEGLKDLASERGLPVLMLAKPEILSAYGQPAVRNRLELRDIVRHFWPELSAVHGKVEPFVVDAAAAALYADTKLALERIPV